jgi:hypothetical protein
LPATATAKERVKELVNNGISLSTIFHTTGPSCISKDERFKELLAQYKKSLAEYSVLEKKNGNEVKGKQMIVEEWLLADDYKHLLKWKLGEAYSLLTSGMKIAQLKQLWEFWKDTEVPDIELPPAPVALSVPEPNNTALGRTVKQKLKKQ